MGSAGYSNSVDACNGTAAVCVVNLTGDPLPTFYAIIEGVLEGTATGYSFLVSSVVDQNDICL